MKIEINDKLYTQIKNVLGTEGVREENIISFIEETLEEEYKIKPTKEERKEWKELLYNSLWFLATERPEFAPRKKDTLNELKESFFYWADTYNDGYFTERDKADKDRYCAWLVQEYNYGY